MKKVSIIIPVYNSEKYIEECLRGILNQSYKEIEVVAINDGSTDNSPNILEKMKQEYGEKLKVFHQANQGIGETRNRGIQYATGDYLMFVDNDDSVEFDYVEKLLTIIEDTKADMVVGGCRRVDAYGKVIFEHTLSQEEWSKYRIVAPWSRIIRRKFVLEHNICFGNYNLGEDSLFTITCYNYSPNIVVTDYIGYNWIYRGESVSNTLQKGGMITPLPFLEELVTKNSPLKNIPEEMFEYFITKFLIWHLTFVSGQVSKKQIDTLYSKYFGWMDQNFPQLKNNSLFTPFSPKGESCGIRLLVWVFVKFPRVFSKRMLYTYRVLSKVRRVSMKRSRKGAGL